MRKIAIGLLAGAGALMAGSANDSDIYTTSEYTNSDLIQQDRIGGHHFVRSHHEFVVNGNLLDRRQRRRVAPHDTDRERQE